MVDLQQDETGGHGPTAVIIAHAMRIPDAAERQRAIADIRELRKRYAGTAAEFKAPNGKESLLLNSLGEENGKIAWYVVRTENFKKRFGDWEVEANAKWLLETEAVTSITGDEFQKRVDKDLVTQVTEYFESIGGEVERPGIGTVILDRSGVKSSIGHKLGRKKAAAFAAVPEIIKQGRIIDHQANWKGRGYETYVIDAPISIGGESYIGEVVLTRKTGTTKFYLHEVETQEKLRGASIQAGTESGTPQGASQLIIGQRLNSVKPESVSKTVDKNGEPLPDFYPNCGASFAFTH